jgi:Acyl-CoA dehydrogenase, C-terminal domain
MAKMKASEGCLLAAERVVQVCGERGSIDHLLVEKWYRDAKLYPIFEGTREIQQPVIVRRLADSTGKPSLHQKASTGRSGVKPRLRGSRTPSTAGIALLRAAKHTPSRLQWLPRSIASAPKRARLRP